MYNIILEAQSPSLHVSEYRLSNHPNVGNHWSEWSSSSLGTRRMLAQKREEKGRDNKKEEVM